MDTHSYNPLIHKYHNTNILQHITTQHYHTTPANHCANTLNTHYKITKKNKYTQDIY